MLIAQNQPLNYQLLAVDLILLVCTIYKPSVSITWH